MSRSPPGRPAVSLALLLIARGAAMAQGAAEPALVGGPSGCPTPSLVWQHLLLLVPGPVLVERLRAPAGAPPPVQLFDLGSSFRVTAGDRVREYADEARDCDKRAQFAAVFVAVATGADPASASPPPPERAFAGVATAPTEVVFIPRVRLDVGASVTAGLGGGETATSAGVSARIGFGTRRLIPVGSLTLLAPLTDHTGDVAIRRWQATADADLRTLAHDGPRSVVYVELGAALEVLSARATNLAVSDAQFGWAVGPRAAAGLIVRTSARLSPFVVIHGIWFPGAPELFALPAGDLGRAVWNLGVTAGASWGIR